MDENFSGYEKKISESTIEEMKQDDVSQDDALSYANFESSSSENTANTDEVLYQNQSPYMQQPYISNQPSKQKGEGVGLGIASMVLGLLSVLLFCSCINLAAAVVGIVLGIVQLAKNKQKSYAIVGIVTSSIAIIISMVFWILMGKSSFMSSFNPVEEQVMEIQETESVYELELH